MRLPASPAGRAHSTQHRFDGLRLIALFKFLKAALLLLTIFGVRELLRPDLLERLLGWSLSLTDAFPRRLLTHAIAWAADLSPHKVHMLMGVSAGYVAVVLVEGVGLWRRIRWVEWLTVVATASLLPFELYELAVRPPGRRLAVVVTLALNVLILGYLVRLLRRQAHLHGHA